MQEATEHRIQMRKRKGNIALALAGGVCVLIVVVGLLWGPRHSSSPQPQLQSAGEQTTTPQPSATEDNGAIRKEQIPSSPDKVREEPASPASASPGETKGEELAT